MHINLISKVSVPGVIYDTTNTIYSSDLGVGIPLVTTLRDNFVIDKEMIITLVEIDLDGMFFYLHYINGLEVMISFQENWLNNWEPVFLLNSANINELFHRLLGPASGTIVGSIDTPWSAYIAASDNRIDYYLYRIAHLPPHRLVHPVYTPTTEIECRYWEYANGEASDFMETQLWKLSMEYNHYLRLLPLAGTDGGRRIEKLNEKSVIYYYDEPLVVDQRIIDLVVPTMFENSSRSVEAYVTYSRQGQVVSSGRTTKKSVIDQIVRDGHSLGCSTYGMTRISSDWGEVLYQVADAQSYKRQVSHAVAKLIHPNQRMYKHYQQLNSL